MPIGLTQVDASKLIPLFKELRAQGVTELKAYIDEHPEFLAQAVEALEVEEVNQHILEMFGARNAAEMRGPITHYWQPGIPTIRRSIEARYRGDEVFQEETKVARMDGSVIDVLFTTARPGAVADKSLIGFIDITERKKAEEALRLSEQRYRHLFHHTPVALWQLDGRPYAAMFEQLRASGVQDLGAYIDNHPQFLSETLSALIIDEVNDHAIQMFGARDRTDLTDNPTHWMWRDGIDTLRRSMESRWRGEESFQETTKLVTRDGRVIDALYTVARPPTVEGLPISLVSMIDLTERVRAQEKLRLAHERLARASQAASLAELSASIAHEVNQPLAAIVATSHACRRWLSADPPNLERAQITLERIIRDANSASEVVSRIRALFSQMSKTRLPTDVTGVIAEVCELMTDELGKKNIQVETEFDRSLPRALIDRVQMQQVLINLIRNAIDASDAIADGTRLIRLRAVRDSDDTIRIEVRDFGAGLKEPERAFEPFFTTKGNGMGMGLAICRSIIEAHDGRLWAIRNEPRGTTLAFTLPVPAREAA